MSERVLTLDQAKKRMGQWISTDQALPPTGVYVLARHTRGTWSDDDDQEGVNYVVVKRRECKAHGNNLRDYEWDSFGPDRFFGQRICAWMYFPRLSPPRPTNFLDPTSHLVTKEG